MALAKQLQLILKSQKELITLLKKMMTNNPAAFQTYETFFKNILPFQIQIGIFICDIPSSRFGS